jgi:hypothetical protein
MSSGGCGVLDWHRQLAADGFLDRLGGAGLIAAEVETVLSGEPGEQLDECCLTRHLAGLGDLQRGRGNIIAILRPRLSLHTEGMFGPPGRGFVRPSRKGSPGPRRSEN